MRILQQISGKLGFYMISLLFKFLRFKLLFSWSNLLQSPFWFLHSKSYRSVEYKGAFFKVTSMLLKAITIFPTNIPPNDWLVSINYLGSFPTHQYENILVYCSVRNISGPTHNLLPLLKSQLVPIKLYVLRPLSPLW